MPRRKKSTGVSLIVPPCPNCPEGTSARIETNRDRVSIVCARCGHVLDSAETPVAVVNGKLSTIRLDNLR